MACCGQGVPLWATSADLEDMREAARPSGAVVKRAESAHRNVIRGIGQDMGEPQVVVETRHAAKRYRY